MTRPILTLTLNPAIDVSTSVPKVAPDRKLRCGRERRDAGGGGINVARVIHRLGGQADAIYPAGGASGASLQTLLDREGVRSRIVPIAGDTREDFTVFDEASGQQYRFILPGPHLRPAEWRRCLAACADAVVSNEIVCASGSLPPGAPSDVYARLARRVRRRGGLLALDTSGAALKAALAERVFLIKPNLNEMRDLTGLALEDQPSMIAACRDLIGRRAVEVVALTLGAEGALLVAAAGAWRASPLPIEAASTVGAGDSFLAAMILALASDKSLQDAFRLGVAAGSAALLAPGTELCLHADVLRLARQVRIEPLAPIDANEN